MFCLPPPDSVHQDESAPLSQVRWKWNLRNRRGNCWRTRHYLKAKVLHAEHIGHRSCSGYDDIVMACRL